VPDKKVDIQLLRAEADRAGSAGRHLAAAREKLTSLRELFAGDHWGASAEGRGLRDALVGIVDNRLREVGQLISAADKIRDGLRETADLEEKTEEAILDSFRKTPIS
jgi:hypothetical protein